MSRKNLTARSLIIDYHMVMKNSDKEVDQIIVFIRDSLSRMKSEEFGKMTRMAREGGLSVKNMTDFSTKYEPGNKPHFRTTYKMLKILLGRRPVELEAQVPIITIVGGVPEVPKGLRPENYYAVPMVEDTIAAGRDRIVADHVVDIVWVYKPEIGNRRNLVAVKMASDADSMEPTLRPGDIVIIDREDRSIDSSRLYAVRTADDPCAIKRVSISQNRFWLISDNNKKYPPQISEFDSSEDLIIGRVIWSWTSWVNR